MAHYSVYNTEVKEIRTDFAYYTDKAVLQKDFETYFKTTRGATEEEILQLWKSDAYQIIETPLHFIGEAERCEIGRLLLGSSNSIGEGYFDDLEAVEDWQNDIKYIIEIKEFGFASAWYIVVLQHQQPFVMGYKRHDGVTRWVMNHDYKKYLESKIYTMSYQTLKTYTTI
ncbi:hypothetical protein [Staphylococcus gallinarum]|uniref:hypothetical protein n=1 Tax=Staphylococcus gallinarum TaxID=1293 RepID=UPI002DBF0CD4|nr:hypothetical protein [Staphylococcus gallinarum]MEB6279067.1 hypothetical protein [Staphylococcus gallinarum]